jgi:hypothetical protein
MKLKEFTFKRLKNEIQNIELRTAVIIILLSVCAASLSLIAFSVTSKQDPRSHESLVKLSQAYQMLTNGTPREDVIYFLRSEGLTENEIAALPSIKSHTSAKTKIMLINGEKAFVTIP